MAGIQLFLILVRWDMFKGWWDLAERTFVRRREFVSIDAKKSSNRLPNFEMLKVHSSVTAASVTKPSPIVSIPTSPTYTASSSPAPGSPMVRSSFTDYLTPAQRPSSSSPLNFSVPRRPSSARPAEHDSAGWENGGNLSTSETHTGKISG